MMSNLSATPHLDDSELLHLVDRDASAWELDRWSQHALACEACSARLRTLQRRTERFSRMLGEVQLPADFDHPQLPSRAPARVRPGPRATAGFQPGWIRAAAVVLVVLLPLVAVDPLRAWVRDFVSDRWTEVAGLLGGGEEPSAPPAEPASGSTLWFTPEGEELVVEISTEQAAGELVLRTALGSEGSLEVVGGGAGETPVIVEEGVRVQTSPASTASYSLTLPATVRRVRVRVGAGPPAIYDLPEIQRGVRLDLR